MSPRLHLARPCVNQNCAGLPRGNDVARRSSLCRLNLSVTVNRESGSDAERISRKFLDTVLHNFQIDHTIREKYDVVAQSQITHIGAGYTQNVIGFGWTNGVFLSLLQQLPPAVQAQLN